MPQSTVHLRVLRYADWIAWLKHYGWLEESRRWEFQEEILDRYEYDVRDLGTRDVRDPVTGRTVKCRVGIDTGSTFWVHYHAYDGVDALAELESFARRTVHPLAFTCPPGHPGRTIEELDWPPLYGWIEYEQRSRDPEAFVSLDQAPYFLTVPCEPDGTPSRRRGSPERLEAFTRARQFVEGFMDDADRNLRFEGPCLTGPDIEEFDSERQYRWYDDTEEEQRRARSSDLGKRRGPREAVSDDRWAGQRELRRELVEHVVYGSDTDTKGRKISRQSADEEFQSVLAQHLEKRRAATKGVLPITGRRR